MDRLRTMAHNRLAGFNDRIIWKEFSSDVACKYFHPGYFDIVYIDGDHSFNGCYSDIIRFFPLIKPGGVIGGHDIMVNGVLNAVSCFCDETNNKFYMLK